MRREKERRGEERRGEKRRGEERKGEERKGEEELRMKQENISPLSLTHCSYYLFSALKSVF
jgi:hypothetical protein